MSGEMDRKAKAGSNKRYLEVDSDYDDGSSDSFSDFDSCSDEVRDAKKMQVEKVQGEDKKNKKQRRWSSNAIQIFDDEVEKLGLEGVSKKGLVAKLDGLVSEGQIAYRLSRLKKSKKASNQDLATLPDPEPKPAHLVRVGEGGEEEKLVSGFHEFLRSAKLQEEENQILVSKNADLEKRLQEVEETLKKEKEERKKAEKKSDDAVALTSSLDASVSSLKGRLTITETALRKEEERSAKNKEEWEEAKKIMVLLHDKKVEVMQKRIELTEHSVATEAMRPLVLPRVREAHKIEAIYKPDCVYKLIEDYFQRTIGKEGHIRPSGSGKGKPPLLRIVSIHKVLPPSYVLNEYFSCLDRTIAAEALLGKPLQRVERVVKSFEELRPVQVTTCQGGKDYNERLMWHGTRPENVKSIQAVGLDPKFSQSGMFGDGNYFAAHSSKSDCYTKPDKEGVRTMFLFRVNLGNFNVANTQRHGLKHAGECEQVGFYDSIVALTKKEGGKVDYPEAVVFDRGMAVPQYKITYRHKMGCMCTHCE